MKHVWKMLALGILFSASLTAAANDQRTISISVEKMTCATCPITVRAAMRRVNGVKTVNVDLESKTATVTYDASVTNASDIADASSDIGFPARVIDEDGE